MTRWRALVRLSDDMLRQAQRAELEKCVRILASLCAHYRSTFGDLPLPATFDLMSREAVDDDEAAWVADAHAMVVEVLGKLNQQRRMPRPGSRELRGS